MTPKQMAKLMANPPNVVEIARPWREFGGVLSSNRIASEVDGIVSSYGLASNLEDCGLPVAISTFARLPESTTQECN